MRTVLGTMSIPHQLDLGNTVQALEVFRRAGHVEVDTAIMYEDGLTERTLGERKQYILLGKGRGGLSTSYCNQMIPHLKTIKLSATELVEFRRRHCVRWESP